MITLSALVHNPKSAMCYARDNSTLHVRLRSAKDEIEKVTLWIGDPYEWAVGGLDGGNLGGSDAHGWTGGREIPMAVEAETQHQTCWLAEFTPPKRRARYGFILYSKGTGQKILFGERKSVDITDAAVAEVELSNLSNFFCFPYINPRDVLVTPEWVKKTVWYHIFPDRFANGRPDISPVGTMPWGTEPTQDNFMGGDLWGVIDKLDYLQDLGINGLYFCPVFTANANHRYDTVDYFNVDPSLGGNEAFTLLVKEAHHRGMKIMLDAVFNHVGDQHPLWLDVVANGKASPYHDWFWIREFPVYEDKPREQWDYQNLRYETFGNVASMPKLNTENEQCRAYLLDIARRWVEDFDIDGWRLDVGNEIDHDFWRDFRRVVKSIKPDCYILGEIWHDASAWLGGDQYDSVMNYPLTQAMLDFFAQDLSNKQDFIWDVSRSYCAYSHTANQAMFNLLDSHDTSRILSLCGENKAKARLAYLFMFTQVGTPCIYYGGEIALSGGRGMGSEANRRCMIWDEEKQDHEFKQFIKELIALRKSKPDFNIPTLQWLDIDSDYCIAYQRGGWQIVMNNSAIAQSVDMQGETVQLTPYGYRMGKSQ